MGDLKTLDDAVHDLKLRMIDAIRDRGLPVGYVTLCMDAQAGWIAEEDGSVTPIGYAKPEGDEEKKEFIGDLDLVDLAYLLEAGELGTDAVKSLLRAYDF